MYIPNNYYREILEVEEENKATPSLYNYSTGKLLSINEVWNISDSQILISDLEIRIKPSKTRHNNYMHQDYEEM